MFTIFNRAHKIPPLALTMTVLFWVINIMLSTIGETAADFYSDQFGFASFIGAGILMILIVLVSLYSKRDVPWLYWMAALSIAFFSPQLSDTLHHHAGIPLIISTPCMAIVILVLFAIWHRTGSADVRRIKTRDQMLFYWVIILFTFVLGTALGDLVSGGFELGHLHTTLLFGCIMVVVPALLYALKINSIALYWVICILARPFGASLADLLSHPAEKGGFNWGTGTTSLIFLIIMILVITFSEHIKKIKVA